MDIRKLIWVCVVLTGKECYSQNSADIINYINTYKDIAISEMQRTGVPAAITLAQGIHETEAGTSDLVRKSNNHFGIKCKDNWKGNVVYHDDDARGECFRGYDVPQDSYRDHSDFLKASPRYGFLFQLDPMDYEGWAYGLKKAGYATNTRYSQILIRLIRDYNLQQYTLIAMGKLKPSDEVLVSNEKPVIPTASLPSFGNGEPKPLASTEPALPVYPEGEFYVNKTLVIFAHAGTSLLNIADQHNIVLSRLMDFNDLINDEVLVKDQLIYLQRKRKVGSTEFHIVRNGESLYDICQQEGVRYESLLDLNQLKPGENPAAGEKIYLQDAASSRPLLVSEKAAETVKKEKAEDNTITHIVQTKETLFSISKKYGVDATQLQQWNKLDSTDLKIGQELIIYKN